MCKRGTVKQVELNGKKVEIDACIAKLVKVLNDNGFETESACCGHGGRPGHIRLTSGMELMVVKDWKMARAIETHFGDMHGTSKKKANSEKRRKNR